MQVFWPKLILGYTLEVKSEDIQQLNLDESEEEVRIMNPICIKPKEEKKVGLLLDDMDGPTQLLDQKHYKNNVDIEPTIVLGRDFNIAPPMKNQFLAPPKVTKAIKKPVPAFLDDPT